MIVAAQIVAEAVLRKNLPNVQVRSFAPNPTQNGNVA
jgi:hypothetical protein